MASGVLVTVNTFLSFFFILAFVANARQALTTPKFFNVMSYGAVADGKTDNSKAFLQAWNDACQWKGKSRVWIPKGRYLLNSVTFMGDCQGPIAFIIKGDLMAPTDPTHFFTDRWITFRYVDQLVVKGGGYLYGQGAVAWPYNDCQTNSNCHSLPVTMRLEFISNSRIHHLRSIDSKNFHFNLFGCQNVNMSHLRISAPGDSPNTDGIHIGSSNNIKITDSYIGTGDDCVSMFQGSSDIQISQVTCGPGHGFSIGSLGKYDYGNNTVTGISIRNCTLIGTQNGLRIKTWAPSLRTLASDVTFEDVVMHNVSNPIFIDQQYCPAPPCNEQAQSAVQINNVTFQNIRGTSASQNAITIKCSGLFPCQNVKLANIHLAYNGPEGLATSFCHNAHVTSYSNLYPPGCP